MFTVAIQCLECPNVIYEAERHHHIPYFLTSHKSRVYWNFGHDFVMSFASVSKTPNKTMLVLYVLCLMKPDKVNLKNPTLTIYTSILCWRKTSRAKILIKLVWMFILRPERKAIWNFPQMTSPVLLIYLTVHYRSVFIS